eukprot:6204371-Pleurochrysis_carterae.AAC.2
MSGMRTVWPRLNFRINVTAETWVHKVGQEAAKKLKKLKQAQSSLTIKISPVTKDIFEGLHDHVCNLQPPDGGRHVTPFIQVAGSRGGDKKEFTFEIVSGALTALFFKPVFVDPRNQGSLYLREDGNAVAIIPPLTFRLRYTLPTNLADFVMSVSFDVAALPRDGVFRFDEASVEISEASKAHMKLYIAGELRKMLSAYTAMDEATGRNLLTPQQLVQVNHLAPATGRPATTPSSSQASTGTGVVDAV